MAVEIGWQCKLSESDHVKHRFAYRHEVTWNNPRPKDEQCIGASDFSWPFTLSQFDSKIWWRKNKETIENESFEFEDSPEMQRLHGTQKFRKKCFVKKEWSREKKSYRLEPSTLGLEKPK